MVQPLPRTSRPKMLPVFIATLVIAMMASVLSLANDAEALENGVAFGAYAAPINGLTNQTAIERLEQQLGAKLPMVRTFSDWDDAIGQDKPLHRWIRDGDRELMASIKPKRENGQEVRWSDIANAQPGSKIHNEMLALADGVKRFGDDMILGFHHEPEHKKNLSFGDSGDFKAAFRKLHDVFAAEGVTNARFAWIMTAWSFEVGDTKPNDRRVADKWYPGDDVVDYISVQEYNWADCRNGNDEWESLQEGLAPFMRFARKHPSKPLVISEFGSPEGASGAKAKWLDDARDLFKRSEYKDRFAAILYFHYDDRASGNTACDWWLDSSGQTLDAARRLARDSFYQVDAIAGSPKPAAGPAPVQTPDPTPAPDPVPTPKPSPTPAPAAKAAPIPVDTSCDGRRATIVGTPGDDRLTGTSGDDVIHGLGGDDVINGLGGNDIICGGYGDDAIKGSGGSDRIIAGPGADFVLGGFGPDTLIGGAGPDRMNGQHGNDTIYGNQGIDVLRGGPHQDLIMAGDHRDRVFGQGGFDTIFGGKGDDTLSGGVGADKLTGGPGSNVCNGGPGRNTITC